MPEDGAGGLQADGASLLVVKRVKGTPVQAGVMGEQNYDLALNMSSCLHGRLVKYRW